MAANLRTYGAPPFGTALIHGGPGAAGELAPVAREMSLRRPVLEPLQTGRSIDEQVEELRTVLLSHAEIPITLVGFSWGAWLSLVLSARHPELVGKLVLVSSGPLEERYASGILETRLGRLGAAERDEAVRLLAEFDNGGGTGTGSEAFGRLGAIWERTDAWDPEPCGRSEVDLRPDIFRTIWPEAAEWRRTGKLMGLLALVKAPVTAIHGDHDPHPAGGVLRPLAACLPRFRFILLENCGHRPWLERSARHKFFRILDQESNERSRP